MASPADIMKARYGRGGFRPFLPGQMLLLSHAPDPDPDPAAVEMTMKVNKRGVLTACGYAAMHTTARIGTTFWGVAL